MKIVISNQNLSYDYGLELIATSYWTKESLMNYYSDTIDKMQPILTDSLVYYPFTVTNCLSKQDIEFMLKQKSCFTNFYWDAKRLGFTNCNNDKNWYSFSVPLFSLDKSKVLIQISSLSPGLCGTGWTILFTKNNNKWTARADQQWIH